MANQIISEKATSEKVITVLAVEKMTRNKIMLGDPADRNAFLNVIYIKKGIFDDRILDAIRVTIEPIYDLESQDLSNPL